MAQDFTRYKLWHSTIRQTPSRVVLFWSRTFSSKSMPLLRVIKSPVARWLHVNRNQSTSLHCLVDTRDLNMGNNCLMLSHGQGRTCRKATCYSILVRMFKTSTQLYLTLSLMDPWIWLLQDVMESKGVTVFKKRISPWLVCGINLKIHNELLA